MTVRALFNAALSATRDWHATLPDATGFCPWPNDLVWRDHPARLVKASDQIVSAPGATSETSRPLLSALQALAPHLEWRHTYTVKEVGQTFLDHYGWFELAGPQGHFVTHQTRITVGYWGCNLHYPRHQHLAEELYTVVSGRALFQSDSEADANIGPGGTRQHRANQPHSMTTTDSPILTLVFWRGDGLADPPRMSLA